VSNSTWPLFSRFLLTSLFCFAFSASAQWVSQDIVLSPGWNAVYLEMQPTPSDCSAVFSNRAVESVWMWNRRFSTIEYEVDPNTLLPDDPHWMVWFPESNPEAFLSRLNGLNGSTAYLIKVPTNAAPYTLTIKGRAEIPYFDWFPHALNLVGLPVNPGQAPTFMDFFRHTSSIDTSQGYQNELFEIRADGSSVRIVAPARKDIESGVAYWIKCAGKPDSTAPLQVDAPEFTGLDFGTVMTERDITLSNPSSSDSITVNLRQVASESPPSGVPELAGDVPLSYLARDPGDAQWSWQELAVGEMLSRTLAPGEEWLLRFGVRRGDFPAYTPTGTNGFAYQSVIEVLGFNDSVRYRVGVRAEEGTELLGAPSQDAHKGLWVGKATLYKVNCPAYTNVLLQADSTCHLRLLVHVDDYGQARLLQEAFMAYAPLTPTTGVYRLYADRHALPADAENISHISSVTFPFMAPVSLTGSMTNILEGTVTVDCNDPVNPFLHRFNPLHDNKDWDGNVYTNPVETLTVRRDIAMDFTEGYATNAPAHPLWGVGVLGGTYRETLTGLREQEIRVEGGFTLSRISEDGELEE